MEPVRAAPGSLTQAYALHLCGGLMITVAFLGITLSDAEIWGWYAMALGFGALLCALRGAWAARRLLSDWRLRWVTISALLFLGGVALVVVGAVVFATGGVSTLGEWLLSIVTAAYAVTSILAGGWWFVRGRRQVQPQSGHPGGASGQRG